MTLMLSHSFLSYTMKWPRKKRDIHVVLDWHGVPKNQLPLIILYINLYIIFTHYWIQHKSLISHPWVFFSKRLKTSFPVRRNGRFFSSRDKIRTGLFSWNHVRTFCTVWQATKQWKSQIVYRVCYNLVWQLLIRSERQKTPEKTK